MAYTATSWVNGTTPLNATNMNHLETQYLEAINSLEQDLFTAFVYSGGVATKDGSIANQLDVTQCVYFALQSDSSLRRRVVAATNFTTSTPSTTYYLDYNPDQTTSWATSHSGQANYLPICSVTTDGSGNILVVTDARTLTTTLLHSMLGTITVNNGFNVTGGLTTLTPATGAYDAMKISNSHDSTYTLFMGSADPTYGAGAGAYLYDGKNAGYIFSAATKTNITFGGNINGPIGGGIPTTRNGAATSVPIYTGASTPSSPPTGSIWVKA